MSRRRDNDDLPWWVYVLILFVLAYFAAQQGKACEKRHGELVKGLFCVAPLPRE